MRHAVFTGRCAALVLGLMALWMTTRTVQAQPSWRFIDTMSSTRFLFDAFQISDHEILIVGGQTVGWHAPGATASCDILDIDTRKVVPGPSMNLPHGAYAAAQMPDGAVVVFGGAFSQGLITTEAVERFDPRTRTWEHVGILTQPRMQMRAIALDSHRILVVGGRLSAGGGKLEVVNTSEIFDLRTGQSTRTQPHLYRSSMGVLVKSKTGQFLSFGGRDGVEGSTRYSEVLRYDTTVNRWRIAGGLPTPIYGPVTTRTSTGDVYALGGSFQETRGTVLMDTMSNVICKWNDDGFDSLGVMAIPRATHCAVQYDDSTLLVAGGKQPDKSVLRTCEWIDLRTMRSTPGPDMKSGRSTFVLVSIRRNGTSRVFAIGGLMQGDTATNSIEELITCDPGGWKDFGDEDYYSAGITRVGGGTVVLTETQPYTAGAVWSRKQVDMYGGFSASFTFRMTNGHDNELPDGSVPGADGIVFVVQNSGTTALGKAGEGIGYEGIPKALAVEFDTYLNPAYGDPNGNHIAVQTGGLGQCRPEHIAPYNLGMTTDIVTMIPDGRIYHGKVDYQGNRLSVYLDTTGRFEHPALVVENVDIAGLLGTRPTGTAWIGFTAATGKSVERHELLSWRMSDCSGLVATSVGAEPVPEREMDMSRIVPMPSHDAARLFSTVRFRQEVTLSLLDVTGRVLETATVETAALQHGVDLPFRVGAGTYFVRISDDTMTVAIPWVVLP